MMDVEWRHPPTTPSASLRPARLRKPATEPRLWDGVGGKLARGRSSTGRTVLVALGVPACRRLVKEYRLRLRLPRRAQDAKEICAEAELWRRAYQVERERAELLGVSLEEVPQEAPDAWQASFEELRTRNAEAERQRREESREAEAELQPAPVEPPVEPPEAAPEAKAEAAEEFEDVPKVFSLFNLPPTDELGEEVVDEAVAVMMNSDFPALAAFLGVPVSQDSMRPMDEVRALLGLDTDEIKDLFEESANAQSAKSLAGRVCIFSGRRLGCPKELLAALQKRGSEADAPLLVFLEREEDEEDEEDHIRIFVFLQRDLPALKTQDVEDLQWLSQSLGIITASLCVSQIFAQTNLTDDVLQPLEIWPWDSDTWQLFMDGIENVLPIWPLAPALLAILATGLVARQGVAQMQGQEIIQIPLPSSSIGHISSTFFHRSAGRLDRAADFDLAAAAPLAMLAASAAAVALGVAQVKRSVAPLQLPAVQLPASLAAALGYPIPIGSDELVTLSTNLDALEAMPLVPLDALLLGGSMGLTAAAASLLPVAGFDGHQIARAAFGSSNASLLEFLSLTALCLEVGRDDLRGTFASEVVLIFMIQLLLGRRSEEVLPPQDNVTPVGVERQITAALLLATSAVILLPAEAWEALKELKS